MKCYQCKLLDYTEEHLPFCSKLCHEAWAEKNHPKKAAKTIGEKLKGWEF